MIATSVAIEFCSNFIPAVGGNIRNSTKPGICITELFAI